MSERKFLPYGRQTIEHDDLEAVNAVLKSDFLTTGPQIPAFEKAFAKQMGAKEAVVVGNGTQALHLACLTAGLGKGDHAIVPSTTFLATANAVRYCGADVLFADTDPKTGLLTPEILENILKTGHRKGLNIKAVLPVHLAGQIGNQSRIKEIADSYGITVISDSCHALGSTYKTVQAGSCVYEDMATFSFHPVKTIAMGEGGAITTNSAKQADYMRKLRSHAMVPVPESGLWAYEMVELGFNYRATDMQCALGLSQLKKLDRFIRKRKKLARLYDSLLEPLSPIVRPPLRLANCDPAWHLYAVRIDFDTAGIDRDFLMRSLKDRGIGTQVHYIPVHTQPYYRNLYGDMDLPGAVAYYNQTLSLPLFPAMKENDVDYVVGMLSNILG